MVASFGRLGGKVSSGRSIRTTSRMFSLISQANAIIARSRTPRLGLRWSLSQARRQAIVIAASSACLRAGGRLARILRMMRISVGGRVMPAFTMVDCRSDADDRAMLFSGVVLGQQVTADVVRRGAVEIANTVAFAPFAEVP